MKILLISNMYPSKSQQGYGSFVQKIESLLSFYGNYKFKKIVIKGRGKSILHKSLKYIILYFKILLNYWGKYEFIYIHYPLHVAWLINILRRLNSKQTIILNYHGSDLFNRGWHTNILSRYTSTLTKHAEIIIVPSLFLKTELEKRKLITNNVYIYPSGGIDTEKFVPQKKHFQNKIIHVGYVGRIEPFKGWIEFLKSIQLTLNKIDLKTSMVGYGADIKQLQNEIKNHNLDNKIDFRGYYDKNELVNYYNEIDILIFSSQLPESLGLVGIEALACGTPVIATNIGAIPSYISHGKNGFLVEKGNILEISKFIIHYSTLSSEEKIQIRKNCIDTAVHFSSKKVTLNLINFLNEYHSQYR